MRYLSVSVVVLVVIVVLLAACSGPGDSAGDGAQSGAQSGSDQRSAGRSQASPGVVDDHGDGRDRGPRHGAGGHHSSRHHRAGGHQHHAGSGSPALASVLVATADLPPGYHAGGHHDTTAGGAAPPVPDACAPIGELLGSHPTVRQHAHPQASVSFSKSHFGPQVSETIIDYNDPAVAAAALSAVQEASRACGRYVQSRSPVGANTYTVSPTPGAHRHHPGHHGHDSIALRLAAVGAQFDQLFWDVWVTRADDRLVAVGFRSVPSGDNSDWHAAIAAAQAALDRR